MISLLTFIFLSSTADAGSLAIALNASTASTSTSNPSENHIKNGASLKLEELGMDSVSRDPRNWIDHGETTERTLKAISEINLMKPRIVVGMGNSFQAILSAKEMTNETVLISPVATSDEILKQGSKVVLLSNTNSTQAKLLVNEFDGKAKKTATSLVIEVSGCPYCTDFATKLVSELKSHGRKTDIWKIHVSELSDLSSSQNIPKNFDHIFVPTHEAEAARLIGALFKDNSKAAFWGGDGWGSLARYITELPFAKALQAFWLSHYHPEIINPQNRKFVAEYKKRFNTEPVDTSALYYEAVGVAHELLKGTKSASDIKAKFTKLRSYNGLTGKVRTFSNSAQRQMPLLQLSNGSPKFVKLIGGDT